MKGYIYFAQNIANKNIKVGFTRGNPVNRLNNIRSISGIEATLIGAVEGVYREEQLLHKIFAHLNVAGEWFKPDILRYIKHLNLIKINHLDRLSRKRKHNSPKSYFVSNLNFLAHLHTVTVMSNKLDISKSLLHDWASGRRLPSGKNMPEIVKISRFAGVSLEDFYFKNIEYLI